MPATEKLGKAGKATVEFRPAISYNPSYQSVLKDLKQSTRQPFVRLQLDCPAGAPERNAIERDTRVDAERRLSANGLRALLVVSP